MTEHSFIGGGGEMGHRIREFEWSSTPLGPPEEWPQSLRSALSIMLPSRAQIAICWGPEFITLYNDGYRPVFGGKHPAALGMPISRAWDELWRAGLDEMFNGVVRTGDAFWARDMPFFMERNGFLEETYFDVSYDPIRDESGKVGGLFCIVSETTGRVVGERRLGTLSELARVLQAAKTVEEVFALAGQELSRSAGDVPFALLYRAEEHHAHLAAVSGLQLPHKAAPEIITEGVSESWPMPTGSITLHDLPGDPVHAGPWPECVSQASVHALMGANHHQPMGYIVLGVNPRQRVDESYAGFFGLIASHISGALANARRSEDERRRAESLAELDRAKTTFFTNISHEFRTPLSLLLGPIEEAATQHAALQGEALELAFRNGQRLLRLVNGLLDFARIQAGRLKPDIEHVDLGRLTQEFSSAFRSAAEQCGLRLIVDTQQFGESIEVDVDMFERIISNLLSNALKFTREGEIRVSLRSRGNQVELEVKDTGVGIEESELPRLFERFHRIEGSWSRTQEGSGIGLAMLKDLVALHGGNVDAQSTIGLGTTITVTLPKVRPVLQVSRDPQAKVGRATGAHSRTLADEALGWTETVGCQQTENSAPLDVLDDAGELKQRVLIVDDNQDMRKYLCRLLSGRWDVRVAGDGMEALQVIESWRPELFLSDIMMPRMDGFGLISSLRGDPRFNDIKIMLLSARAGEEARIEALHAGADDFVVKPFSARELVARVEALLLKSKLREIESEQGKRLAEVFEQAPVGIAILRGPDHRYEFVNDQYLRLIDRRPVKGLPIREAMAELEGQGIYELLDRVYESKEVFVGRSVRLMVVDRGGEPRERFFDFVYQPTLDAHGSSTGIAVVVYDVTALTEARGEADRANRAKDEFLAVLGHELRNPLAPIITSLQVMKLGRTTVFQKEREIIGRQTQHLVRLVDDLLDVSRIASGKVQLRRQRVDLREVIATALETASPVIQRRRHRFESRLPDRPLWIEADATRLAQVISNLLVNAAKYTPEGGNIRLNAAAEVGFAELRVRDDGVGIDEDFLPTVFELFAQERNALDRSSGGLGLGLAIVKSLVHSHGGEVFASSPGKGLGSEFGFRVPLALGPANVAQVLPEATIANSLTGHRVLIVDDNVDAGEILALALEQSGFETLLKSDGAAALACAPEFIPEIALLDIGLPSMDGNELAVRLKSMLPTLRVIAVTGYRCDDARAIRKDVFERHMLKPVDLPALIETLVAPAQVIQSTDGG